MKSLVVLSLGLLLLSGCKSTPELHLTEPPITVELSNLQNYWIPDSKGFSFNPSTLNPPKNNGFVKIRYLIDSNGDIFNPTIIESLPAGAWDKIALESLKKFKYIPSKTNSSNTPVYVTTEINFGTNK